MYYYNLTKIHEADVKVGDIVGVAYNVPIGWGVYKHPQIRAVKIGRITPKRTKFVSEDGVEFDRYTTFYELNEVAKKETKLALAARNFIKASNDIERWKRNNNLNNISDDNIEKLAELMSEIAEILNGRERDTD